MQNRSLCVLYYSVHFYEMQTKPNGLFTKFHKCFINFDFVTVNEIPPNNKYDLTLLF